MKTKIRHALLSAGFASSLLAGACATAHAPIQPADNGDVIHTTATMVTPSSGDLIAAESDQRIVSMGDGTTMHFETTTIPMSADAYATNAPMMSSAEETVSTSTTRVRMRKD